VLNFSPEKILIVMIFALVVLGPNRLPGAARSVGKVIGQLRQMTGNLQNEVTSALGEPKETLNSTVTDLGLNDLRQTIRGLNPLNPVAPSQSRTANTANPSVAQPNAAVPSGGALGAPVGQADLPPAPDDPSLN
jgi:sec-independent protein translocase protein TatB